MLRGSTVACFALSCVGVPWSRVEWAVTFRWQEYGAPTGMMGVGRYSARQRSTSPLGWPILAVLMQHGEWDRAQSDGSEPIGRLTRLPTIHPSTTHPWISFPEDVVSWIVAAPPPLFDLPVRFLTMSDLPCPFPHMFDLPLSGNRTQTSGLQNWYAAHCAIRPSISDTNPHW
jgi:hypothetical protein